MSPGIPPLSARSVVLSLMLGSGADGIPVRSLVEAGRYFGIADPTLRVALTRMVAAGDLDRSEGTYRLSARLRERRRRQDAALEPGLRGWDGGWEMVVITSTGRGATERAELRSTLTDLRLAELREGLWTRPANLARPLPSWPAGLVEVFRAVPEGDPRDLLGRLWDLDRWAADARALLTGIEDADGPADRLAAAAALVRHLRTDPAPPAELAPPGWPAPELRARYARYQDELGGTGLATAGLIPAGG